MGKERNKVGEIVGKILIVDINQIKPNTYNPKPDYRESEDLSFEFDKIKISLKYHGQIDPLQVREVEGDIPYELVNGYHRWLGMKEQGFKKAEIKTFGKITKTEAVKIALSMEELKIPLDVIEVAQLIKEIKDKEESLEGLPYLEKEIQEKIELLEFDWDVFKKDPGELIPLKDNSLNFVVDDKQRSVILKAIKRVVDKEGVKEGEALRIICDFFLLKNL